MIHLRRLTLCLLLSLVFAVWPGSSIAQNNAISWEVTPGFEGSFKAGAWFPLTITISNKGPDLNGILEFRSRTAGAGVYSQTIDLPLNANKRIVLPVLSGTQDGNLQGDLTLRAGNTVVHSQRLNLNALASMQLVVGVVSDEGNALPELTNLRPNNDNSFGTTLTQLTSADLPERAELLQSFDALFIHGSDATTWNESQRTALVNWVNTGGQLVVGGDVRVLRGLDTILPVTVQETTDVVSGRELEAVGWQARNEAATLPIVQLVPRDTTELVLQSATSQPLLVRQQRGVGSINVAAFGLEALRDVGDPAAFWSRVLRLDLLPSPSIQLREQGFFTLQQSLTLPSLRLPSIFGFFGFLLLYILVVGPLNYVILRRLDRREWAYLTIPVLVLLFSGGAYVYGTVGRGGSATVSELSIVRAYQGEPDGQSISYLALFSPTRRSYDVAFGSNALVSDLQQAWNRQGAAPSVLYAEDNTRIPELLIDVGGVRSLTVEQRVPAAQLEASVSSNGRQITLRNRSDQIIEDVVLARGDGQSQIIGDVGPGADQTFDLVLNRFIQDGLDQRSGIIDRPDVLRQLSSSLTPTGFNGGMPIPPDVPLPTLVPSDANAGGDGAVQAVRNPLPNIMESLYVMGWRVQSQTDVRLDGQVADVSGETLYVWPVRKER